MDNEELHLKNTLKMISDYLRTTSSSIKQITLLEFQQHIWWKIDSLWHASRREQDRTLTAIRIKTYKGKVIDDLERWY